MARRAVGGTTPSPRRPKGPAPGSRSDYVFANLRGDILTGALPPGTPLVQSEIAESLGVSVTPVREALLRLESAGLVTYQLHVGATVTQLGDEALEELYLLRARVEGLAARLAAARWSEGQLDTLVKIHERMERLDPTSASALATGSREFHKEVARIGGPAYILGQIESLWEHSPIDAARSIWNDPDLVHRELACHRSIIEAIRNRDEDEAESIMAGHIAEAIAIRRRHGDSSRRAL